MALSGTYSAGSSGMQLNMYVELACSHVETEEVGQVNQPTPDYMNYDSRDELVMC